MTELPGLDLDALTRWLDAEHPGLRAGELSGEVIAGGRSNLTYRVSDGMTTWALRRPPLGHVLPTAHDMQREHRVISALAGTTVPVATPVALCTDIEVLGAPFYLMAWVDGLVFDRPRDFDRLNPAGAQRACELLIDTLLDLHGIDPDTVGLADFGKADGFLARQVRRWHQQYEASKSEPRADLEPVVDLLSARLPEQSAPGIVHGDYRLTNVMFSRNDADSSTVAGVAAVVDWEMATLGDPLTDVGLLVVYHQLARTANFVMPQLTPEAGFLTADQLVARYAAGSSRDLSALPWYVGFGYFKLAVVAEGIHFRYLQGKTVGAGFEHVGESIPQLLAGARRALEAMPTA